MKHTLGETGFINSEPLQVRIHYGPDLGAMNFATRQSCYLFERFFPQQTHVQIVVGMIEIGKFGLKSKNSDKMMINWHFFESAWGFLSNDR